jgi:probable HAF family extracellular repeat protein
MRSIAAIKLISLVVLFQATASASPTRYSLTPLGPVWASQFGLNNAGQYLINHHDSGHIVNGYGDNPGVPLYVGNLGQHTQAIALNDLGDVVGNSEVKPNEAHAFLSRNGQIQDLGTLGGKTSYATDINNSGHVVGMSDVPGSRDRSAFIYSNGQMTQLPVPFSSATAYVTAINDKDQILLQSSYNAYVYQNGTTTTLGDRLIQDPSADLVAINYASDINEKGQVVGIVTTYSSNYQSQNHQMFLMDSNGTDAPLLINGLDPGGWVSPSALNDFDQIVGSSELEAGDIHGFIYTDGQTLDLNDVLPEGSDWIIHSALAIDNNGQILAGGYSPTAGGGAILLTPEGLPLPAAPTVVPEPSTLAFLGFVACGFGIARMRRRSKVSALNVIGE